MHYYLDCEFDSWNGPILSLALVRLDGESLYITFRHHDIWDEWVRTNVVPHLDAVPKHVRHCRRIGKPTAANAIADFLKGDPCPTIVTDWPDDIKYFCELLITGPGLMVPIPALKFEMVRIDAYPTDVPGAIQHNAWWDAMALRAALTTA